jgi:hypothetical protein
MGVEAELRRMRKAIDRERELRVRQSGAFEHRLRVLEVLLEHGTTGITPKFDAGVTESEGGCFRTRFCDQSNSAQSNRVSMKDRENLHKLQHLSHPQA